MNPETVRLFGTTQPIFESADESYKIGRLVANSTFFKALFRHGDFDEYHLFCPTHANCVLTDQRLKREGLPPDILDRIKIRHIYQLPQAMAENPFQVFHVGGWGFFWPGLVSLREKRARSPFPVTGLIHSLNASQTPFEALKVCTAPARPFDSIVCTSRCGRDALQNLFAVIEETFGASGAQYRGRMDIIPLGIEDHLGQNPQPLQSRQVLNLPEQAFVILYVGRIAVDNKFDPGPLLMTVREVLDAHPEKPILLVLAGGVDGTTKALLRALLAENGLEGHTRLIPNFKDDLKGHLYAAADVYVSPVDNLQETFGLTILEAMVHGCAVVASDFNGYAELVEDGKTGIKIPTTWANCLTGMRDLQGMMDFFTGQLLVSQSIAVDQRRLFQAIERLLLHPEYRLQIGASARKHVQGAYLWSRIIPRYLALWNELGHLSWKGLPLTGGGSPCWWDVDHFATFAHFAARLARDEDPVRLSPRGRKALAQKKRPVPYSDVGATLIHPELVFRVLLGLQDGTRRVGEVARFLRSQAVMDASTALYHILWMLKQGFIEQIDPAEERIEREKESAEPKPEIDAVEEKGREGSF